MSLKKLLLSAVAGLALATSVFAQQMPINTINQNGVQIGNVRYNTYAAASIGLIPAAAGATDFFCISPSASRNVYITNVGVSGTAGTAVTAHVVLLRRALLDTGGTAATGASLPVGSGESTVSGSPTATLTAYTANPTINDASPTYMRSAVLSLPTSSAAVAQALTWSFGTMAGQFNTEFTLIKGTTQQACLNLQSTATSSGLLEVWMEWQEY